MAVDDLRSSPAGCMVFELSGRRYGLSLASVERVARIVDITPLPQAPDIVLGVINVQGRVVPVVNVRRRFGLPDRAIALTDQLIIAHTARRPVALLVDVVTGVIDHTEQDVVAARDVLAGIDYIEGVVKLDDGLILIHDLERFLSLEEEAVLDSAMACV